MNAPALARPAALLRQRFVSRDDVYLAERPTGAAWVREPVTDAVLARHVSGELRIGVAVNGSTPYGLIDLDAKRDGDVDRAWKDARSLYAVLDADHGIVPLAELSRSTKGVHLWVMADPDDPPTVAEMRDLLRAVLRAAGLPDDGDEGRGHAGIFPHPAGAKGIGRAPFLPWSGLVAGATGGLFVDVGDGVPLERQETALEDVQLVTRSTVLSVTEALRSAEKATAPVQAKAVTSLRILDDPKAAGVDRHSALRDEIMRLRNFLPIEETRTIAFALAASWGMSREERGGEIENLIAGAYLKAPIEIATEYQRSSRGATETPTLEPATFRDVSNPDVLKVPWLIEGLIPASGLTIVAAHYKTGKTFLMYRLILDALFGVNALGSFPIPRPLKVQLWQFEMPLDVNLRRFHKLAWGMGVDPAMIYQAERDGRFQAFIQPDISLADAGDLAVFHDAVTTFGPDLLLVDSLSEAFPGVDVNKAHEVRAMLRNAFRPVTVDGRGTVALHHKRKASSDGKPDDGKGAILGSQAFGAAARTVYTLDRVRDDGPETKGRFVVNLAPQGGWDIETSGTVFVIADDAEGTKTTVDPAKGKGAKALKAVTVTTQAAVRLAELVGSRHSIGRQSALEVLRLEFKCGATTAKDALKLALERRWIAKGKADGAKQNEQVLERGPNTDWEDEL